MRTAQSRVWLGQKQSRGYQLYGMGRGGAQSHRDKQFEHIQNHILTDGLGLSLNTPSLSSVSGHTGTNEPHKGTSSTNECKPVQVCRRGSARRASQNTGRSTVADSQQLLPLCSPSLYHTEETLPARSRPESEHDGGSRAAYYCLT